LAQGVSDFLHRGDTEVPELLIKDLSASLHRRLRAQAARNHRSVAEEVLAVLERALSESGRPNEIPPPFKGRFALTDEFIKRARRQGRE
jgi:hypothetical protein